MKSVINKCKCENKGQDSLHGKDNRVMNPTTSSNGTDRKYRCTVCKTLHAVKDAH